MVEAAFVVRRHRQAGSADGGNNQLGGLAATAGRVAQAVEFVRETGEVVDGFQAVSKTNGGHGGVPVRADDNDGARRGQSVGLGGNRRPGRTRAQRKSRRAVGNEKCGLDRVHANNS